MVRVLIWMLRAFGTFVGLAMAIAFGYAALGQTDRNAQIALGVPCVLGVALVVISLRPRASIKTSMTTEAQSQGRRVEVVEGPGFRATFTTNVRPHPGVPARAPNPDARPAPTEGFKGISVKNPWDFRTEIVGTFYRNRSDNSSRQVLLRKCLPGQDLRLVREPRNPHDTNAIMVMTTDGKQLGYIKNKHSIWLAPMMDAGIRFNAYSTSIKLRYGKLGMNITVQRNWELSPAG